MNILHIISAPTSGGAEVYVKDLAKSLSQKGHIIHIAFLSTALDDGRDIEYGNKFIKDLQSSNINTYVIGNETRKKPWLGVSRIRSYAKKHNIDIIHTHLAYGIVFSALATTPIVYTHHNITRRWGKLTYKVFNKIVDEYVGISDLCAEALRTYTKRDVNTIFNAVSLDKFEGRSRIRVLDSTNVINIAMIGTLQPQKDYPNMLKALSLLNLEAKNHILVSIAGEGKKEYKDELIGYIQKYDLQNVVRFIGVTSDIPKFLYDADLFVMSSAWEGLPIALTEAAISGLPCIVTDVGGCSEVIARSKNGVVIDSHNPQALANELKRVIADKSLIHQWSKNAFDSADQYSIEKAANLHMRLYSSILSQKI